MGRHTFLPVYKNSADSQQNCYKHTENHTEAHTNFHMRMKWQIRCSLRKRIPQKRLKRRSEGIYIDKVDSVIIVINKGN